MQIKLQIRKIYMQVVSCQKNHYDALGVSAKATQADVKSAYYKLSMSYHPDKNKDSLEAAQKFRDITEAYEVLGNVKTRKLYDRGLFFTKASPSIHEEKTTKFYKPRESKFKPPSPYGRTTVYDFDEWSKVHYGTAFRSNQRFRAREELRRAGEQQASTDIKVERITFLFGLFLIATIYLLFDADYDVPERIAMVGSDVTVASKSK